MTDFIGALLLSDNFRAWEFACRGEAKGEPCCCHGAVKADGFLVSVIQAVREKLREPLFLTCGYRCETWNKHVGGHPGSYHRLGQAADLTCSGLRADPETWAETIAQVLHDTLRRGGGNVIWYPDNAFIHVDVGNTVVPGHMVRCKMGNGDVTLSDWKPQGG